MICGLCICWISAKYYIYLSILWKRMNLGVFAVKFICLKIRIWFTSKNCLSNDFFVGIEGQKRVLQINRSEKLLTFCHTDYCLSEIFRKPNHMARVEERRGDVLLFHMRDEQGLLCICFNLNPSTNNFYTIKIGG